MGLGAWSFGAYHLHMDVPNARVAAGIRAFKQELIYCGFGGGIKLDLADFGWYADARTREFQRYAGLPDTGAIGSTTARALFRKRIGAVQAKYHIPHSYLSRIKSQESSNDPVAEGYFDADDEGAMQINLRYHPDVTEAQAWDPAFAFDFAGSLLAYAAAACGSWEGAVASWNIGLHNAVLWVEAGYPATGGPIMGHDRDGNPIYAFERATNYLAMVREQPV